MNNRLTIQDLAGLLAEYTGKDKDSSERFLREFIAVVSEGVYADRLVKVKGLGTFKIIPVEKRESIHVNTGERFVIPEHYKFSFLPDKELRELVNKPFSFFETTELSDNVDFTDMDVVSEEPEMKETEDESVEEVIPEEEPLPEKEPLLRAEEDASGQPADEPLDEPEPESPKSRVNRMVWVSLLVFFLAVFNIGLYLTRSHFFEKENVSFVPKSEVLSSEADSTSVRQQEADGNKPVAQPDSSATIPDTATVSVGGHLLPETDGAADVKPEPAASPKILARVKIEPGSRLTLISLKYYGSKLFWVYLYEHNKAIIKNPNNVPIGTVIEVPAPEKYGIDSHDRSSIEKAAARQTEILSGKR